MLRMKLTLHGSNDPNDPNDSSAPSDPNDSSDPNYSNHSNRIRILNFIRIRIRFELTLFESDSNYPKSDSNDSNRGVAATFVVLGLGVLIPA